MRVPLGRGLVLMLGLSLLASENSHAGPMYTVTDLGTLPGTTQSEAVGINANGQVIGVSYNTLPTDSDAQSFIYKDGTTTAITPMGGGPARAINDSGQVVGGQYVDINNTGSFVGGINSHWAVSLGGTVTNLERFQPFAINNSGVVVGMYYKPGIGGTDVGIFEHGVLTKLNTSLSQVAPDFDGSSFGYKINDSGDMLIVSALNRANATPQTLLYNATTRSITNISQLVGTHSTPGTGYFPDGTFPGPYGAALNNHGQIVGNGWLYSSGQVYALNNLIPQGTGWNLTQGLGINDSGQIVGQGIIDGQTHAFLLTPNVQAVPEPTTLGVFVLTMTGVAIRTFKRVEKNKEFIVSL